MGDGIIVSISDDEGNNYQLEHIDTFESDGVFYLAFLPADMDEDDEDYGFVLLKQAEGSDELENLDDDEEDAIYQKFMERLFSDDDDSDGSDDSDEDE